VIGATDDGAIWATGHYRNGILLAPTTADAVAAIVAGESPPEVVAPFSPARFGVTAGSAA
jgi:glycine oxidase